MEVSNKLQLAHAHLTQNIDQVEQLASNSRNGNSRKGIMDHKASSGLKPLIRLWNERLISALDQVYPYAKDMVNKLIVKIDEKDTESISEDWWDAQLSERHTYNLKWKQFSRDLHYLLQQICEDADAFAKHRAAEGCGINADVAMHKWYLGSSGQ